MDGLKRGSEQHRAPQQPPQLVAHADNARLPTCGRPAAARRGACRAGFSPTPHHPSVITNCVAIKQYRPVDGGGRAAGALGSTRPKPEAEPGTPCERAKRAWSVSSLPFRVPWRRRAPRGELPFSLESWTAKKPAPGPVLGTEKAQLGRALTVRGGAPLLGPAGGGRRGRSVGAPLCRFLVIAPAGPAAAAIEAAPPPRHGRRQRNSRV